MRLAAGRPKVRVVTCVALALLVAGGCATAPDRTPPTAAPQLEEVLSGRALFGGEAVPALPNVDILALDDDMRAFLAQHVDRRSSANLRLHQLAYAIINPATFGLQYTELTRTAQETFRGRNGNCLSFTNLFVALAREAGLKARYQQVAIPPEWTQHGETHVLNRHINVVVDVGQNIRKGVDFNIEDFKTSYEREVVPDRRAEAHFYSNTGVEKLKDGDLRASFLYLRKGIEVDPRFAPLWTNLGALYSRAGRPDLAEASYLQSLERDSGEMVATSNLARLYARRGDEARARSYRERARYHRERNPYYRFEQAREAFLSRDYPSARRHLDFAIRKRPVEDSFYFLRGLVNLQLGELEAAREDLERAESVSQDEALKRNYHSKMELLLRD